MGSRSGRREADPRLPISRHTNDALWKAFFEAALYSFIYIISFIRMAPLTFISNMHLNEGDSLAGPGWIPNCNVFQLQ